MRNFHFLVVKFSVYLNRHAVVMIFGYTKPLTYVNLRVQKSILLPAYDTKPLLDESQIALNLQNLTQIGLPIRTVWSDLPYLYEGSLQPLSWIYHEYNFNKFLLCLS